MQHWKTVNDLDTEIIFNVISQYYLDESCSDIDLTTRDREMIPYLAMKDLEAGGEPLIEIQINQEKLQQLLARVRAKQQIAETTGELEQTHSDREESVYDFAVTDELALYHVLMNANSLRQMAGLPDIAPKELLNTATAYQYEAREAMRQMVQVTIDLDILKQAVGFARRSEMEADQDNPYRGES